MARARTGHQRQPALPSGDPNAGLNGKITAYLKNPLLFPPELGAWVRSQVVRNPTVKIETYQLPNLDKKHVVGATGEPAFQNSWVDYALGWDACAFYKDNQQRVWLQGMIKNGAAPPSVAFTLPTGYRPLGGQITFAVISNGAIGRVDVLASGDVLVQAGNNAYVSLNGLSFRIS